MAEKSLANQVALITGGSKRIGRSIALRLASDGADIIINYDSSKSEADSLVSDLKDQGRRALAVQADVSHRADVQKLFTAAENEFGRLDILVNNAGMFFAAKFEELTEEQWDHILDVNLKSQFLCAQSAAPASSIPPRSAACSPGPATRTTVFRKLAPSCSPAASPAPSAPKSSSTASPPAPSNFPASLPTKITSAASPCIAPAQAKT